MECPKCHKIISDNETVCPHCHKVITLVCPNCHAFSQNSVCEKCGHIILEKCAKCGRTVPTSKEHCKCGLSVKSSIAANECETDEYASLTVKFGALKAIRNLLASQELYTKFIIRLKNLVTAQLKNIEGKVILYGNDYVINFNKELSFPTSVNKAIRLAIKMLNAFSGLNTKLQEELGCPLKINIIIQKKTAEELLVNKSLENNVKLLTVKKNEKKYLRGMQVMIDQYSQDCIRSNYKTDSLYMVEQEGSSVMYYELLLDSYVLPPSTNEEAPAEISNARNIAPKETGQNDIYSFKVFDINAKCKFETLCSDELLLNIKPDNKILALRGEKELQIKTSDLIKHYQKSDLTPLYISCTEEMNYKPWGFFEKLFKEYYSLSAINGLINKNSSIKSFDDIKKLLSGVPVKAATPEDARFAYMDLFCKFMTSIKKQVVIVDGFENIDDTSVQTLDLYFDKFKNVNLNFVFIINGDGHAHSKIKGLLRTPLYTEVTMVKNGTATLLSDIKEDAADFIQSFYYDKIKENFNGSKLYFDHALKYLIDKDILIKFENKLLIKNNNSILLPKNMQGLIKNRLKALGKFQDASMILAYSVFIGEKLDFSMLERLGIKNISDNAKFLENTGFTFTKNDAVYINNYSFMREIIQSSLKREVEEFLVKNIVAKLGKVLDDSTLFPLMAALSMYKEEYLLLWKNSQFAINTGDYDAYLKNCLGFLSLTDKVGGNIPDDAIEENKKEVFRNILATLYGYSPEKIYSIENILLVDALQAQDNEKIVKLSNLMLQGALISSNYTEALSLLHNILERMQNPSLIVDGTINTKFLLLSLVNIEILFNIGDFRRCIEVGEDLLNVIKPDIIETIKPVNFSTNLFVSHLMETFRLIGFSKLITYDDDMENFFDKIKTSLNEDLPEKDCITAIRNFIAGKDYVPSNIEDASPLSKTIYLILFELSNLKDNYKKFAQNIHQAKLLASDIRQTQFEYICDLLIAYAYAKTGIHQKASAIFNDILEKSEKCAIYNTAILARYLIAKQNEDMNNTEEALNIINNSLSVIQKHDNQAKLFYALFEKMYIDITEKNHVRNVDINIEKQKLAVLFPNNEISRIFDSNEYEINTEEKNENEPVIKEIIDEEPQDAEEQDDLTEIAESFSDDDSMGTEVH